MATIAQLLNRANPNDLADYIRAIPLGDLLLSLGESVTEDLEVTENTASLGRRALTITCIYAIDGEVTGPKIVVPKDVTPDTGQVSWDGATTLTFAADDEVAKCLVVYVPRPDLDPLLMEIQGRA